MRPLVSYVVVVFQRVSNFGMACTPTLQRTLDALVDQKLVDRLIEMPPRALEPSEKRALVCDRCTGVDLGGATPADIADQFLLELQKREAGRLACLDAGCEYFMSMDCDEFYDVG